METTWCWTLQTPWASITRPIREHQNCKRYHKRAPEFPCYFRIASRRLHLPGTPLFPDLIWMWLSPWSQFEVKLQNLSPSMDNNTTNMEMVNLEITVSLLMLWRTTSTTLMRITPHFPPTRSTKELLILASTPWMKTLSSPTPLLSCTSSPTPRRSNWPPESMLFVTRVSALLRSKWPVDHWVHPSTPWRDSSKNPPLEGIWEEWVWACCPPRGL